MAGQPDLKVVPENEPPKPAVQRTAWQKFLRFIAAPFRFVFATFGVVVGGSIMVLAATMALLTLGLAICGLLVSVVLGVAGVLAFIVVGIGCAIILFLVGILVMAMIDRMIGTTLVSDVGGKVKEKINS